MPSGEKRFGSVIVCGAGFSAIACTERGRSGECYILSGHYASIQDILTKTASLLGRAAPKLYAPASLASCAAPIFEKIGQLRGKRPFFTPYSIAVLRANGHFSNAKAIAALGFHARPLRETLQSTILWFQGQNLIPPAL